MPKIIIKKDFATAEKVEWWKKLQYTIPDPDKILQDNGFDYSIYRNLLSDPHLWSTIQQRKAQVNQMGWTLDNDDYEDLANEIIEVLERIQINKAIDQILDCTLFGFDVEEIRYDVINNKITPIELNQKPVEWFIYSNENELKLRKITGGSYVFEEGLTLPEYKFILSQHKATYQNPYGEKLLSKVYWPITFKKAAIDNWEKLLNEHGVPYIVARHPSNATEDQKLIIEQNLIDLLNDHVGMLSEEIGLEFKESQKYNAGDLFKNMIETLNIEISKAILTVTLTTEIGSTGSYKAAQIHRDMLEMIGLQDKKIVERAINKLIEYYVILNYGTKIKYPKIVLEKKEGIVDATVERDKTLKEMGVKFTKDYFVRRYNLQETDFELEIEQK
ncbi:MAG: DUF935 family protein [Ignavibacteriae bacterium]|nr:DUF935 family protein [Ignavibacteriota bacterium]